MSWEEMYRSERPCECGKGTYIEVGEMDDWNRTRNHQIINCPDCAEREKVIAEEERKEKAEREMRLKTLVMEITTYFEERYMDKWFALFASARNKKEVWAIAKNIKVESHSLPSFYQRNKGLSTEDYIRRFARPYYMEKIIEALNIQDKLLISKIEEASKLNRSTSVRGFY